MAGNEQESAYLRQFLEEEVGGRFYADLLLGRAEAAGTGTEVLGASGDAYYVAFGADEIVVEHHFLEDWVLRLSRQDFIAALKAWRETLTG